MADRVSVAIRVGGSLSPTLLPALCAAIASDDACLDWDGTPFSPEGIDEGAPLYLVADEVAWGRFEAIETFCVEQGLLFARWAGGAPGSFGPERVVFDGTTLRSFAASDDDEIMVSADLVRGLKTFATVLSHLAAAELEIPPFRVGGST